MSFQRIPQVRPYGPYATCLCFSIMKHLSKQTLRCPSESHYSHPPAVLWNHRHINGKSSLGNLVPSKLGPQQISPLIKASPHKLGPQSKTSDKM